MTLVPLAVGNSSWRRLAWAFVAVRFLTGAGEAASYPNANKSSVIGWPRGHGVLAVACCKPGLVQAEYLHPSCSPERYNSETGSTGMDQAVFTKVRKELEDTIGLEDYYRIEEKTIENRE